MAKRVLRMLLLSVVMLLLSFQVSHAQSNRPNTRQRVFIMVERKDLAQLEEKLNVSLYRVDSAKAGHQRLLLISNQKGEQDPGG